MFLQHFRCDSAARSLAKAVAVQISKLSEGYYARGGRVTGVGAGPLQPALQPGGGRGEEGGMKRDIWARK